MAEQDQIVTAQSAAPRFGASDLLRLTAELTTVFAAAAFIASSWANGQVFQYWGLSFLQLASPTDVLMSGLDLIGQIFLPICIAVLIVASILLFDKIEIATSGKRGKLAEVFFTLVGGIFVFAPMASVLVLLIDFVLPSPIVPDGIKIYIAALNIALTVWVIMNREYYEDGALAGTHARFDFRKSSITFAVALAGCVFAYQWLSVEIRSNTISGFMPRALSVQIDRQEVCQNSRLLWGGSQSSVVSCAGLDGARQIMVVRDPENLELRPMGFVVVPAPQAAEPHAKPLSRPATSAPSYRR